MFFYVNVVSIYKLCITKINDSFIKLIFFQDFDWDEEGFSVISRFYDEIAQLLDDKFKTAYNMTYRSMGRLTAIDTTMFRRATWNYIQVRIPVKKNWIKERIRSGRFLRVFTVAFLLFLAPTGKGL